MRAKHFVTGLVMLSLGFFLTGCAGLLTGKGAGGIACPTKDLDALLKSGEYRAKVDTFLLVEDASSSMGDKPGKLFERGPSKFSLSKDIMRCLNDTLPQDFPATAGLRLFGPVYSENGLVYGMTKYHSGGMEDAITGVGNTGGVTPMADAITFGAYDLANTPGRAAMIIFSDGINTEAADPAAAAAAAMETYGDNLCIYTVLLGNDPQGKVTMEQIASQGKCGFATKADLLHARTLADGSTTGSADGMADFVTAVFLEKAPPAKVAPPPPAKPAPIPKKLSITLLVEFDFDKSVVKPQYFSDIEQVANFLKTYPRTDARLEGHTDHTGTEEYNMALSERRAASVKKVLVEKYNVEAARVTTVGYGESKPIATNATKEGRQLNRRVVADIVTTVME